MDVVKELGHYRGMSMRRALGHSSGAGATNANQRDDADARMMFAIMDRSGDGVIDEVRPPRALALSRTRPRICPLPAGVPCRRCLRACMHAWWQAEFGAICDTLRISFRKAHRDPWLERCCPSLARSSCMRRLDRVVRSPHTSTSESYCSSCSRLWPCRPPHMNMGLMCVWFPRFFSPPRYFDVALDGLLLLNAVALVAEDFNLLESGSDNTDLDGVPGARQTPKHAHCGPNARPVHCQTQAQLRWAQSVRVHAQCTPLARSTRTICAPSLTPPSGQTRSGTSSSSASRAPSSSRCASS